MYVSHRIRHFSSLNVTDRQTDRQTDRPTVLPWTEDVSLKTLTFPSILGATRAEQRTAALGYQNVRLEPTTARACVDSRQPII